MAFPSAWSWSLGGALWDFFLTVPNTDSIAFCGDWRLIFFGNVLSKFHNYRDKLLHLIWEQKYHNTINFHTTVSLLVCWTQVCGNVHDYLGQERNFKGQLSWNFPLKKTLFSLTIVQPILSPLWPLPKKVLFTKFYEVIFFPFPHSTWSDLSCACPWNFWAIQSDATKCKEYIGKYQ